MADAGVGELGGAPLEARVAPQVYRRGVTVGGGEGCNEAASIRGVDGGGVEGAESSLFSPSEDV